MKASYNLPEGFVFFFKKINFAEVKKCRDCIYKHAVLKTGLSGLIKLCK